MSTCIDNLSYFQPTGFRIIVDRTHYPAFQFFAQQVTLPQVIVEPAPQGASRINSIPHTGDAITFGELNVSMILDEDFIGYTEILNWMIRQVNTNRYGQRTPRDQQRPPLQADIKVEALTSHNNKNITFTYQGAFPVSLGEISLQSSVADVEYITVPVGFRYTQFDIS